MKTLRRYDYFISYAHEDRALVQRLAQALDDAGVRLWWDRWEMQPGDILRERINAGLEASAHYLVVVSESSLQSNWVRYELNAAFIRSIEERKLV